MQVVKVQWRMREEMLARMVVWSEALRRNGELEGTKEGVVRDN